MCTPSPYPSLPELCKPPTDTSHSTGTQPRMELCASGIRHGLIWATAYQKWWGSPRHGHLGSLQASLCLPVCALLTCHAGKAMFCLSTSWPMQSVMHRLHAAVQLVLLGWISSFQGFWESRVETGNLSSQAHLGDRIFTSVSTGNTENS